MRAGSLRMLRFPTNLSTSMSISMEAFSCGLTVKSVHVGEAVNSMSTSFGHLVSTSCFPSASKSSPVESDKQFQLQSALVERQTCISSTNLQPILMQTLAWKPLKRFEEPWKPMKSRHSSLTTMFTSSTSSVIHCLFSKARVDAMEKPRAHSDFKRA